MKWLKKRMVHFLNWLLPKLGIYHLFTTREETLENYEKLVERLKRDGVWRED